MTTAVIPGGPGVNTYDTVVSRGGAPANDVSVYLQLVNPQRGIRSAWYQTERVDVGLVCIGRR